MISEVVDAAYVNNVRILAGNCDCIVALGVALGGGYGRLMSFYGFGVDNFLSVNLVTAHGDAIILDASQLWHRHFCQNEGLSRRYGQRHALARTTHFHRRQDRISHLGHRGSPSQTRNGYVHVLHNHWFPWLWTYHNCLSILCRRRTGWHLLPSLRSPPSRMEPLSFRTTNGMREVPCSASRAAASLPSNGA